jgi:hypothetical protein
MKVTFPLFVKKRQQDEVGGKGLQILVQYGQMNINIATMLALAAKVGDHPFFFFFVRRLAS